MTARWVFGTFAGLSLVMACGARSLPGGAPEPREAGADAEAGASDAGDTFYRCEGGTALCDANLAHFDRDAAACALGLVPVAACRQPSDPTGAGHVRITFAPSGDVVSVDVEPPFRGTPTAACLVTLFGKVKVPPFCGESMTVGKSFSIP